MTSLFSWPMRVTESGYFPVEDAHSEAYTTQEITVLLKTTAGERVLVPAFGINDPAFSSLGVSEVESKVAVFEIPAQITDVVEVLKTDGRYDYRIEFDPFDDVTEGIENA